MIPALKCFSVLAVLLLVSYSNAHAATICPTTASTNTDCAFILTIGSGGVVTGSVVAGATPYDGSDDALVGVVNNSGSAYTGSILLSGSGNGGGIFAFDGDGICSGSYGLFTGCSTVDSTGYGADGITFSSLDQITGDVNIANLANGGTAFFSLESSPSSINSGGGGIVVGGGGGGAAPEPSSMILMATGLLGMGGAIRRRLMA